MVKAPLYDHHFFKPEPAESPVFVVGLGRSGTTMLRLMLHQHSAFAMLSETWFGPRVWDRRWAFPFRQTTGRFFERMVDSFISLLNKYDDFPMDLEMYRHNILSCPQSLSSMLTLLGRQWASQHEKPLWGEKTPVHVRYLSVLARMYPGLKVVHIVRDPRDVALSLAEAPFVQCADPVCWAIEWLRGMEIEEQQKKLEPALEGRLLYVRYEDLVTEPERVLTDVCEHLEQNFDAKMLDFQGAAQLAPSLPWMSALQHPLSQKRIGRWRKELDRFEVELIESLCGQRMRNLGYACAVDADRVAELTPFVQRLWAAQRSWEEESARATADHVSMHRGEYRDLVQGLTGE